MDSYVTDLGLPLFPAMRSFKGCAGSLIVCYMSGHRYRFAGPLSRTCGMMPVMNIETFFAATDLVVVGTNPEMADYDNQRGDIIRSAAYVYAEDERGNRRRLWVATGWESEVLPKAEALAAALTARLANMGKQPVGFTHWEEARPAYGSEAYDPEDEIALERREAEDEMFA